MRFIKKDIKRFDFDNKWKVWFAWYPVTVTDLEGREYRVWLETLRRKKFWYWTGKRNDFVKSFYRYQFDAAWSPTFKNNEDFESDEPIERHGGYQPRLPRSHIPPKCPPPPPKGRVISESQDSSKV